MPLDRGSIITVLKTNKVHTGKRLDGSINLWLLTRLPNSQSHDWLNFSPNFMTRERERTKNTFFYLDSQTVKSLPLFSSAWNLRTILSFLFLKLLNELKLSVCNSAVTNVDLLSWWSTPFQIRWSITVDAEIHTVMMCGTVSFHPSLRSSCSFTLFRCLPFSLKSV